MLGDSKYKYSELVKNTYEYVFIEQADRHKPKTEKHKAAIKNGSFVVKNLRNDLTEKDIAMICFVLGKKKDDYVYIQKGKNAINVKKVLIKDINKEYLSSDGYLLLASKLHDENKVKISQRTRVETYTGYLETKGIDAEGNPKTEYHFSNSIQGKKYISKKKYYDTTSTNIKRVPAIVIDIDNHTTYYDEESGENLAYAIDYFMYEECGFRPQFINYTGRGLQLFFSVNEYDPSNKKMASLAYDLNSMLKKVVKKILEENLSYETKRNRLTVDDAISVRRQLVRLPGTINSKSDTKASCVVANFEDLRFNMAELIKDCRLYLGIKPTGRKYIDFSKIKKDKKSKKKIKSRNKYDLLNKRLHDDKLLLNHRGEGFRHLCYTNMITSLFSLGKTEDEAVSYVSEVDNSVGFYTSGNTAVNHVRQCYRGLEKKAVDGVYKIKNSTIEEKWYNITEDEYMSLEFKTYGKVKNKEKKLELNRRNKREKIEAVIKAYAQQLIDECVNVSKIAKEFKLSRTTVYSYIKNNEQTIKEIVEKSKTVAKELKTVVSKLPSLLAFLIDNLNRKKLNTPKLNNFFLNNQLSNLLNSRDKKQYKPVFVT